MFIDPGVIFLGYKMAKLQHETEIRMREALSPEEFKIWKAEQVAERRHQELCQSIREAGKASRPQGIGLFW